MRISFLLLKLCVGLLFVSAYTETIAAEEAELQLSGAKPGCPTNCGNLTVPYPFGIGIECALREGLYVTCDETFNPPKAFIGSSNLRILGFSANEVRIGSLASYKCYNESGVVTDRQDWRLPPTSTSSYTFSAEKNVLVSVGCNTYALIRDRNGKFTSGCVTICEKNVLVSVLDGSCSGIGCCHTLIPKGLKCLSTIVGIANSLDSARFNSSTCSSAFMVEHEKFQFQASDLDLGNSLYDRVQDLPMLLDWVVENITCKDARRSIKEYACQENTFCVDSNNAPGYRCSCRKGYEGNPYLPPGCKDINECEDSTRNQCVSSSNCINLPGAYNCTCPHGTYGDGRQNSTGCRCIKGYEGNPYQPPGCKDINECEDSTKNLCLSKSNCINLPGTYNCTCPHGTHGDGRQNSTGCIEENKEFPVVNVTLGIFSGNLLVLLASCWLYFGLKKRRVARLKRKFFKQNRRLLQQERQIYSQEGATVNLNRIYTAEELKLATNNYDESRILGRGGNGTVYKGIFPHGGTETVVAIKKSKLVERSRIGQFINEVVILTQINHRHVVKILGCCLETEVPLLVYEFIPNKTLHEHIHNRRIGAGAQKLSWQNRLRIATETAGALAYLHSAASIPIIHRDVKSSNILLDDEYNTKVADFGASKFIPLDQSHISTLVQGTLGYLDPEYFQTCELTEKSDVYSFGVILVELMTEKKAVFVDKYEGRLHLATHFILSMQEKALLQIIAKHLVDEDDIEQLFAVAELALKCLKLKGEERPTMRQVVGELEGIKKLSEKYSSTNVNEEETIYLLDVQSDPISFNPSSGVSIGHYNINSMMFSLDLPR